MIPLFEIEKRIAARFRFGRNELARYVAKPQIIEIHLRIGAQYVYANMRDLIDAQRVIKRVRIHFVGYFFLFAGGDYFRLRVAVQIALLLR